MVSIFPYPPGGATELKSSPPVQQDAFRPKPYTDMAPAVYFNGGGDVSGLSSEMVDYLNKAKKERERIAAIVKSSQPPQPVAPTSFFQKVKAFFGFSDSEEAAQKALEKTIMEMDRIHEKPLKKSFTQLKREDSIQRQRQRELARKKISIKSNLESAESIVAALGLAESSPSSVPPRSRNPSKSSSSDIDSKVSKTYSNIGSIKEEVASSLQETPAVLEAIEEATSPELERRTPSEMKLENLLKLEEPPADTSVFHMLAECLPESNHLPIRIDKDGNIGLRLQFTPEAPSKVVINGSTKSTYIIFPLVCKIEGKKVIYNAVLGEEITKDNKLLVRGWKAQGIVLKNHSLVKDKEFMVIAFMNDDALNDAHMNFRTMKNFIRSYFDEGNIRKKAQRIGRLASYEEVSWVKEFLAETYTTPKRAPTESPRPIAASMEMPIDSKRAQIYHVPVAAGYSTSSSHIGSLTYVPGVPSIPVERPKVQCNNFM